MLKIAVLIYSTQANKISTRAFRSCLRSREQRQDKAKTAEEAAFTRCGEHSEDATTQYCHRAADRKQVLSTVLLLTTCICLNDVGRTSPLAHWVIYR